MVQMMKFGNQTKSLKKSLIIQFQQLMVLFGCPLMNLLPHLIQFITVEYSQNLGQIIL